MKSSQLVFLLLTISILNCTSLKSQSWAWARSATGNEFDQSSTVIADAAGNVYVAGYFASDSITFGNITLQNSSISFDEMFIVKYDPNGNVLWAQRAGGADDDKPTSLSIDPFGNIFLAGYYKSTTITFGSFTLNNTGNGDIFLVKYDNTGNVLWAKSEGGLALEIPYSITNDAIGNLYVAGRFSSNSITFGTTTLLQQGSMDVFLVKYNSAGNIVWAKGAGSSSNDEAYGVTTDPSGNIFVTGYFNQNFNIGTFTLTTAGLGDIFVAKYDSSGTVLWANRAGGSGDDRIQSIKTDANGNAYVAGYFASTSFTMGGVTISANAGNNSVIGKYDPSGNVQWAHNIDGNSKAYSLLLINNQVYFCGTSNGDTLHYGPSTLMIDGNADFFIGSCDNSGNKNWAIKQTSGGNSGELAYALASSGNNLFVAGDFDSDPLTFGSSTISNTDNGFDMFVAKLGGVSASLPSQTLKTKIAISPNPTIDNFTINTSENIDRCTLYSITGELVYDAYNLNKHLQKSINISRLTPGIYFVEILTNGQKTIEKLVKINP
ncbi:hypothetical protein BH11BAC2_BH11BAC2_02540 [soil metagenome]